METASDIVSYQLVEVGPDPRLTTTTTFDADGMAFEVVQAFDAEAFVTSMTYDADFWMATRTLPTGATESWTYDDQGRALVHVDPAGVVRELVYGPDGQIAVSREGGEVVEETVFANDLPSGGAPPFVGGAGASAGRSTASCSSSPGAPGVLQRGRPPCGVRRR